MTPQQNAEIFRLARELFGRLIEHTKDMSPANIRLYVYRPRSEEFSREMISFQFPNGAQKGEGLPISTIDIYPSEEIP